MAYKGSKTQRSRIKGLSQAGNKAASDVRLDNFIESNRDLKNQSTYDSLLNTVSNKPQRFSKDNESRRAFIERNLRADGTPNSAAQAMLDFYDDGRNDYSRGLNSLRTSSQPMMDAYARKFPIENFAMNAGPMAFGAMTGIPVAALQAGFDRTRQGAELGLDTLKKGGEFLKKGIDVGASAIDKGMNFAQDRVYDIEDAIEYNTPIGDLPEAKDKIIDIFKDAIAKREDDSTSFTPQNRPMGPRENTVNPLEKLLIDSGSVDTAGVERLFKLPRNFPGDFNNEYFTNIPDDSLRDNYLVRNPQSPYFANSQQPGTGLYAMNLNQGGLASLNNEDYMQLMGASNFGF